MNNINTAQIAFGAKMPKISVIRIPLKTGETAKVTVSENSRYRITSIVSDVFCKGKITSNEKYHNKKGFSDNKLAQIVTHFEQIAKDKNFDFYTALLKADKL